MHTGFQISNILENIIDIRHQNNIYMPHYSIFDLILSYCDIGLDIIDANINNFLEESNNRFVRIKPENFIKSYSSYIVNSPLAHFKNNNGLAFHLNTIIFSHDINLLNIKKEDAFLLCMNSIKPNDTLIYFSEKMRHYNCDKINKIKLEYSIPDELSNINNTKNGVAVFCYNKTISDDLVSSLGSNVTKLTKIPDSIEKLNTELNKYEIFIEFDPSSIINSLCAVACGGISIIVDPNNTLSEYNIPGLYKVGSIDELNKLLSQKLSSLSDKDIFDSKFRNFIEFKNKIISILDHNQRKAFCL